MGNQGWVSLHRNLLEWEWYSHHNVTRVFIHLILKANHAEGKWRGKKIKPGELLIGEEKLAAEIGISHNQLRDCLTKLISTGEIKKKTNYHGTHLQIVKYNEWQGEDRRNPNKQRANNGQLGRQLGRQPTSNNNNNNDNNDNNDKIHDNSLDKLSSNSLTPNFSTGSSLDDLYNDIDNETNP